MIKIEPQPRNGSPFRIHFANRGDEYWYNETVGWPKHTNKMLFDWKCPYGVNGKPKLVDGIWYWVEDKE